MDLDSSSKFIASLARSLQSLCNGYVKFNQGVEVIGHIYLSVDSDTSRKIDYILNEKVCKNNNSLNFISNSFHAQPARIPQPAPEKSGNSSTEDSQDNCGQAIPNSTNAGTMGTFPGGFSKRPKSPSQRRISMSRCSGGPSAKSPQYGDLFSASAEFCNTDGPSTDNDSSTNSDEDCSNSDLVENIALEPDISIVKEEMTNQQQPGDSYPNFQPSVLNSEEEMMAENQAESYSQFDGDVLVKAEEGGMAEGRVENIGDKMMVNISSLTSSQNLDFCHVNKGHPGLEMNSDEPIPYIGTGSQFSILASEQVIIDRQRRLPEQRYDMIEAQKAAMSEKNRIKMASLSTFTTKYGKTSALVDGFKFALERRNQSSLNWKCIKYPSKCPARCTTDLEITTIFKGKLSHNHEKPDLEKSQFQEKCKKRALEDPDEGPSKIIMKEMESGKINIVPREMASIRQAIYLKRKSLHQNLPKSCEET